MPKESVCGVGSSIWNEATSGSGSGSSCSCGTVVAAAPALTTVQQQSTGSQRNSSVSSVTKVKSCRCECCCCKSYYDYANRSEPIITEAQTSANITKATVENIETFAPQEGETSLAEADERQEEEGANSALEIDLSRWSLDSEAASSSTWDDEAREKRKDSLELIARCVERELGLNGRRRRQRRLRHLRQGCQGAEKAEGAREATTKETNCKINNARNKDDNEKEATMRNIITPVRYEPNESAESAESTTGESNDSLEASLDHRQLSQKQHDDDLQRQRSKAAHQTAVKGVPVLPTSQNSANIHSTLSPSAKLQKKLQKTNWQPPTDWRKYEQLPKSLSRPGSVCPQDNSNQQSTSAQLAATGGPQLIKHQPSSSRRLLSQLARLRRLSEPDYRVKRPEKVAQVEALIDQLERATAEWEEDELLLDRAERRDWPARYYKQFSNNNGAVDAEQTDRPVVKEDPAFGERLDVNQVEIESIERSHLTMVMGARQVAQANAWPSYRQYDHRYNDDLAVRRLGGRSPAPGGTWPANKQVNSPQTSYLLCSNAYTPDSQLSPDGFFTCDSLDRRRARVDDLHYRSLNRRRPPHEPPFGIPRQLATASTHSSATHYLRQQSPLKELANAAAPPACRCQLTPLRQPANRSDSRVSFVLDTGRSSSNYKDGFQSADSGVAPSPIGRHSTASRLTPQRSATPDIGSKIDYYDYVDDVAQEVDLDAELIGDGDTASTCWQLETPTTSDSPALEMCRAEVLATPTRRRPQIKLENPRAKSPLVKVSTLARPKQQSQQQVGQRQRETVKVQCYSDKVQAYGLAKKPTSEAECHYVFDDEDDDDDISVEVKKPVIKTTVSDESSMNESSIERLDHRGVERQTDTLKNNQPDNKQARTKKSGPIFSIGQYKPLNKSQLKIL